MLNRTDKNNENNRGEINKKDLKNEIYPVWQGYMDEDRTLYSVRESSISENKVNQAGSAIYEVSFVVLLDLIKASQ